MIELNDGWWRTTVETLDDARRKLWFLDWGKTKGNQSRRPTRNMIIDALENVDMHGWPEKWVIIVSRVELRPTERFVRSYRKPECFDTPRLYVGCDVRYIEDGDDDESPRGKIVADDAGRTMTDYQDPRPLHRREPELRTAPAWLVLWDYPFRMQSGPFNSTGAEWIWKSDKDLVAA